MTQEEQIEREMDRELDELERQFNDDEITMKEFNEKFRETERAAREELADLKS